METNGKIFFEETQHFRVKWVWMLILLSVLSSIGLTIGLGLSEKEDVKEALIALTIVIPIEVAMLCLFYVARLETIVTSEGIYYRWWPFQRKGRFIAKADIEEANIRTGPAFNYGYHTIPDYGKVFNAGPGEGVQFVLNDGRKLFVGSKMSPVFLQAISRIINVSRKV